MRNNRGLNVLHLAASGGYLEVGYLIEEKGFDFNIKNGAGASPLRLAAANGHRDILYSI